MLNSQYPHQTTLIANIPSNFTFLISIPVYLYNKLFSLVLIKRLIFTFIKVNKALISIIINYMFYFLEITSIFFLYIYIIKNINLSIFKNKKVLKIVLFYKAKIKSRLRLLNKGAP